MELLLIAANHSAEIAEYLGQNVSGGHLFSYEGVVWLCELISETIVSCISAEDVVNICEPIKVTLPGGEVLTTFTECTLEVGV